jgi:hypothetical protein
LCFFKYSHTANINDAFCPNLISFTFFVSSNTYALPLLSYHNNERFLEAAQKVANGILTMIDENTWDTTHVLNYPDLSVKEKFRIV